MHRKLLILTVVAFLSMGRQCAPPSTPITPQTTKATKDGNSGISGTTRYLVISGAPGGPTTGGPASIEFAIAPVEAGEPVYDKAIFVKSDAQGMFQVELAPGTYWLGPKAKALDPEQYVPGAEEFTETVVVVEAGAYTAVELVQTGYAP